MLCPPEPLSFKSVGMIEDDEHTSRPSVILFIKAFPIFKPWLHPCPDLISAARPE